jgi:hypothetical protein
MKTLLWAAAILGASASALAAQQQNIWIANRGGGGTVCVLTPARAEIKRFTAADGISVPWDIVYVPAHNVVVVSNNGNGTLSVIDATTLQIIQNVSVPLGNNLRGMSVSGDQNSVFVAGLNNGNSGVFQLSLPSRSVAALSNTIFDTTPPEDCVVINASRVGGSGNGPGKVYYSVPGGNYIGVLTVNPPGPDTSISLGSGALAGVSVPTQLSRTPDHSAVFAGCQTNPALFVRVVRIVPGVTDTPDQPPVRSTSMALTHFVRDVEFRPSGPPFRGFVNLSESGGNAIAEIDDFGSEIPATAVAPPPAPGRLNLNAGMSQLFVGETSGTSNQYGVSDVSSGLAAVAVVLTPAGTSGPAAFAFSPRGSAPVVSDVSPSGMLSAPGTSIEIRGAHFTSSTTVAFFDTAGLPFNRTVNFVDPGRLLVNGDGLPPDRFEIRVTNPDLQTFRLVDYFLSIQGPVPTTPYVQAVPGRFQGYELRSVPQYLNAGDLLSAVSAQFGGYNPSNVRVFLQEGSGYTELNQADPGLDLSGRSFWILSRFGGPLSLSRPPVGESLQVTAEDVKVVILQPGWNMVAQPALNTGTGGRMSLADIFVFSDSLLTVPAAAGGSLIDSATATVTSFPVIYSGGSYVVLSSTDHVFAGEGYWLRNNTTGPLYMRFLNSDAQAKGIAGKSAAAKAVAKAAGVPDLPPPPPGAALAEDGDTSGCGLPGLEVLAVLGFLLVRRGRKLAA